MTRDQLKNNNLKLKTEICKLSILRNNNCIDGEILNLIEDLVIVVNREMTNIFVNQTSDQLFGIESEDLIGKSIRQIFPDDEAIPMTATIRKVFQEGKSTLREQKLNFPDREVWLNTRLFPIRNEHSDVDQVLIISRDITDHKQNLRALNKSDEKFRFLAENMADIVWTLDLDLNTTWVSPSIRKILGYTPEERYQQPIEEMMTADSLQNAFSIFEKQLQEEQLVDSDPNRSLKVEIAYYHADGNIVWMECSVKAIRDLKGTITGIYGSSWDITNRRQAEQELSRLAKEWETTFDSTNDVIWILDQDQRIQRSNKKVEELFKLPRHSIVGKHCWEIFHGTTEPIPECPFVRLRESLQRETLEMPLGDQIVKVTTDPILSDTGQLDGVVHKIDDITKHKLREKQLYQTLIEKDKLIQKNKNSENRARDILELLPNGIIEMDDKLNVTYLNQAGLKMLGLTNFDLETGINGFELIHADDQEKAQKRIISHAKNHRIPPTEYKAMRKNGGSFPILFKSVPVLQDGELTGFRGSITDISEIRESESRFKKVVENASEAIVIIQDGKIVYGNPMLYKMSGYTQDELAAASSRNLIHLDDYSEVVVRYQSWPDLVDESTKNTHRLINKMGEARWAEIKPSLVSWNNRPALMAFISDVTLKKEAEEALKTKFNRMPGFYNQELIGVTITSLEKQFIDANDKLCDILGYHKKELVGMDWAELTHPNDLPDEIECFNRLLANEIDHYRLEKRCIRKDGKTVWVKAFNYLSSEISSSEKFIVGFMDDITQRKQSEKEIQKSLNEKKTLLHEIHHRVKNNMQVVASLLDMQSQASTDVSVKRALRDAQGRVFSMSAVHDMLHASETLSHIDLAMLIPKISTAIMQAFAVTSDRIKLYFELEQLTIGIQQATSIGLIINELISNALKHAFPDNRKGEITVKANRVQHELEFIVSDNGTGYSDNFDWQNSESLGLKLVHALVEEQLDGSLNISSNKVRGTIITCRIVAGL